MFLACAHRGANGQPDGGALISGGEPGIGESLIDLSCIRLGMLVSSPSVYG
jgi:hypothetical protein